MSRDRCERCPATSHWWDAPEISLTWSNTSSSDESPQLRGPSLHNFPQVRLALYYLVFRGGLQVRWQSVQPLSFELAFGRRLGVLGGGRLLRLDYPGDGSPAPPDTSPVGVRRAASGGLAPHGWLRHLHDHYRRSRRRHTDRHVAQDRKGSGTLPRERMAGTMKMKKVYYATLELDPRS